MKGKDFIVLAAPPWELEIGSNIRNMALEISKDNRVIYVNPPVDRNTLFRERNNKVFNENRKKNLEHETSLNQINENLWVFNPKSVAESINWIPVYAVFEWANRINVKRLANEIKTAVERLNFKEFIVINDSLMFKGYEIEKHLLPKQYLYYTRDNLVTQPYFKKHGVRIEPKLMAAVDAVIANSVYLRDYAARYNKNSYFIGQGYENENFDCTVKHDAPKDMVNIARPVIGYIGSLTSMRLDINLIIYIAKSFCNYSVVLVGPEDEAFKNSELHHFDNVHFLGLKKMEQLAAYVAHFDVCINPQLVNDLTVGNYPIKIDEYLAMGKPTVVTNTPTMKSFEPYVYTASGYEEFTQKIRQAIDENSMTREKSRIDFAHQHNWSSSVDKLYNIISKR